MNKAVVALLLLGSVTVSACIFGKPKPADTATESAEPTASGDADMGAGDPQPSASTVAEAVPAKPTKDELEQALTPPAGVVDLRPIIGTDPDQALPAIFAAVKKGTTAKELDAIFPGVGAHPKIAFISFTKQGAKWVRVVRNQKHRDLLDIAYDDAGGVRKIGFMFDPATSKPELWEYLKKASHTKWGKPESDGDLQTWKPAGVKELSIHRSSATDFSIGVEY